MCYVEIYNEQLKDLLCPSAKLDVVEGLSGVDIRGCTPVEVTDVNAVRSFALCNPPPFLHAHAR